MDSHKTKSNQTNQLFSMCSNFATLAEKKGKKCYLTSSSVSILEYIKKKVLLILRT